jgi:hypothetical protein
MSNVSTLSGPQPPIQWMDRIVEVPEFDFRTPKCLCSILPITGAFLASFLGGRVF